MITTAGATRSVGARYPMTLAAAVPMLKGTGGYVVGAAAAALWIALVACQKGVK